MRRSVPWASKGFSAPLPGCSPKGVYIQGRLDEARLLTEEAEALTVSDDIDAQARWRATRAKLLARRGHFPPPADWPTRPWRWFRQPPTRCCKPETLVAKAEVTRLAGARGQAAASLRAALRIYEDRHAIALSEQTRIAIASLTDQPSSQPG